MRKLSKTFNLTKLAEECGELQHIACKTILKSKERNILRLEEEIADVLAATSIIVTQMNLNKERILNRVSEKLDKYDTYTLIIDAETGLVLS
jgi:NTP pyrophosphatase (non-canonical NTP hydrolase)